jgi:hypothetical protein
LTWISLIRFHRGGDPIAGSLLFAVGHALGKVRLGSVDDEAHAVVGNKIVRKCLDKGAITYKDYKVWRKKNPLVFTTVVDENNELIGFFDIFPLTSDAGEKMVTGDLTERSLNVDHILPLSATGSATHIHVATILVNPRQRAFTFLVAKEVLLLKMKEFFEEHYAPVDQRTYTAFGQSKAGEALLKRCGFSVAVLASESDQRSPLYVLRPGEAVTAIFRFDRADERLSHRAVLSDLDVRIQRIELRLRAVIASALNRDANRLPPHVNQKADERVQSAAKKDAAFDADRYRVLPEKLEFCDLRELEDTVLSKALWPHFQARFTNKETLGAKFGQMAELRNSIRHSRAVDEITRKEGEAGILWFERVLAKVASNRNGPEIIG